MPADPEIASLAGCSLCQLGRGGQHQRRRNECRQPAVRDDHTDKAAIESEDERSWLGREGAAERNERLVPPQILDGLEPAQEQRPYARAAPRRFDNGDVSRGRAGRRIRCKRQLRSRAGWNADEHRQLGLAFPPIEERADLLEDQLAILHGLWGEPDGWSFEGITGIRIEGALFRPRPVDVPGRPTTSVGGKRPRIIVGSSGSPRSYRLAARYADEYNLSSASPSRAAEVRTKLDEACRAIGRDPATLARSTMAGVLVTAVGNLYTVSKAIGAGMFRVLCKPLDFGELVALVSFTAEASQDEHARVALQRGRTMPFTEDQIAELTPRDIQHRLSEPRVEAVILQLDAQADAAAGDVQHLLKCGKRLGRAVRSPQPRSVPAPSR